MSLKDRKSTRLNSSHQIISYAVFCLKKKKRLRRAAYPPPWIRGRRRGTGAYFQTLHGRAPQDVQQSPAGRRERFFCNDTATTEIYTLSLHNALPISGARPGRPQPLRGTKGKRKGARLWYVGEIGRAGQQECRDRYRMASSA